MSRNGREERAYCDPLPSKTMSKWSHFLDPFFFALAKMSHLYTILPNLPRPGGANAPGASHAADGIVGALSHPYTHPPMGYGFPQGGASSSSTFPPPGSMYPGYSMPIFSQPVYPNVSQPLYYPYL